MKAIIKLIAVVLLLLCVVDFDPSFGQLLRWAVVVAFAYLAYDAFKADSNVAGVVYAVLAVLFQPLYEVQLGPTLWKALYIVAALFVISMIVGLFGKKN
ncbi:MAG: hypothetical protein IJ553_03020 [Alloprevotella sp.]|nr:hypothetical protein [Alloprevotella sp.]